MTPSGWIRACRRPPAALSSGSRRLASAPLTAALAAVVAGTPAAQTVGRSTPKRPKSPIEHLIVIVGENHTFDNLFGVYQPGAGQTVSNLLSKRIVNEDGTPGPNFAAAEQQQASDITAYMLAPPRSGPFATLPQPNTTYALGLLPHVPDTRFPAALPSGPFQITKYVPYTAFTGDPPHRFFQMWQQFDEGNLDLFAWVDVTAGIGPQNVAPTPTALNTLQGGEAILDRNP